MNQSKSASINAKVVQRNNVVVPIRVWSFHENGLNLWFQRIEITISRRLPISLKSQP